MTVLSTALLRRGKSGVFAPRHAALGSNFATAKFSGKTMPVEPPVQMKCVKCVNAHLRTLYRIVRSIVMSVCGHNGPPALKVAVREYTIETAPSSNPCTVGKVVRERMISKIVT
jgi:hypothetical protein